jgi:Fe2+ transport system protein FeoA
MMKLSKLKIGSSAKIVKVGGEGALRDRFLDMGLTPKTIVKVVKKAPLGDPIEITLRSYELTLRIADAEKIEVEEI